MGVTYQVCTEPDHGMNRVRFWGGMVGDVVERAFEAAVRFHNSTDHFDDVDQTPERQA